MPTVIYKRTEINDLLDALTALGLDLSKIPKEVGGNYLKLDITLTDTQIATLKTKFPGWDVQKL